MSSSLYLLRIPTERKLQDAFVHDVDCFRLVGWLELNGAFNTI